MKSLAAILVGLRQLFSWRATPRLSSRSLHESLHESSPRDVRACPDHCDSENNQPETLVAQQTEKFADLRRFIEQHKVTDWQPLSDTESSGVSEVYTYHELQDGTVALGLVSWHRKHRAFDYVKQMILIVDTETDEMLCQIEGPTEQIKPILAKLISFLKKS